MSTMLKALIVSFVILVIGGLLVPSVLGIIFIVLGVIMVAFTGPAWIVENF